jgi:hypothetical protein
MSQGSSSISNGSTVISDAGANVAQVLEYYPFGGMRIDQRSGSLNEQRRFTSHEFDTGTMHSTEGRVSVILALIRAIEKSSIQFGKNVRATSLGIRGMSDEKSSCVSYFTLHDRFLDYSPKKEADRLVSRCSPDSQIRWTEANYE